MIYQSGATTALFLNIHSLQSEAVSFTTSPLSEFHGLSQAENECHITAGLLGIETIKGLPVEMLLPRAHAK